MLGTDQYTFCNIRLKRFPNMASEWCLRIESEWQLLDYMEQTNNTRITSAIANGSDVLHGRAHFNNGLALVAEARARNKESSFAEGLVDVLDQVYQNRLQILNEGKTIYIKSSGGYSFDTVPGTMYDVLGEKVLDELHFPFEQPRYIQWPNGQHTYAKMGDVDIEWEGKSKWDTRAEAEAAVKAWCRSRGLRWVEPRKLDKLY